MEVNYLVTQSNRLIEARQKKPLTAREQKIILTMVSMIQPTDEDFTFYNISIRDFHELLGLEGREHYTEIKEIVENLMSKVIEIPQSDGGWLMTHWVSTAQYLKGEGTIRLKFVPELKPYLLQLKTHFTSYRLSNILSLKSSYSIRLYELFKRSQHQGRWECQLEILREKLGANNKTYNLYGNLKSKILLPAIKEINEKTDLKVVFKEIKKGRKVEKLEFTIKYFKEKEIRISPKENSLTNPDEIRRKLNLVADNFKLDEFYFAEIYRMAFEIWKGQTFSELEMLVKYINKELTIKSPLGFLKSKMKLAFQQYLEGEEVSFNTLENQNGRKEIIPEWFNANAEKSSKDKLEDPAIEKERQKLLEELKNMNQKVSLE